MKNKYIVLIIVCLISFWACKEKGSDSVYTIDGDLQGLSSPDILLVSFIPSETLLDTITAKGTKFTYKNSTDSLQAVLLRMQESDIWITVWVKNGDRVKIAGDINYPELLNIEGGKINNLLTGFKQRNKESIKKRQDLLEALKFNQEENLSIGYDANNYAEALRLTQAIKDDALLFIKENPSSIASLVLLQDYVINNEDPFVIKTYMDSLTGEARSYILYDILNNLVVRLSQTSLGYDAPNFSIIDVNKDTIDLKSFADKHFLLNFSLSGNDSCRHFADELTALMKTKPPVDLKALTVSLDNDSTLWKDYSKDIVGKWFCAIDKAGWNSPIVAAYNITMITDNVLIGKDGRLLARNIPIDSIKNIINNHQ